MPTRAPPTPTTASSDAYLAAGKRQEALAAAEQALKRLKDDKTLPEEFRTLLRESIEKKIRELK